MRRDEIRGLWEQRANRIHEARSLYEQAEKEGRDLLAEEHETFRKLTDEADEFEQRAKRGEDLFRLQQDSEKVLSTPIEKRVGDQGDAPETLAAYKEERSGGLPQDEPEVRSAYFKYLLRGTTHLDIEEQRALSRATGAAGNFLVPTNFYNQIIRALRWMGSFGTLANEIVTDAGETIQIGVNSAHGAASWTGENVAYTPSDETFAQLSLGAFKATSKVIVSEELLQDSAVNLEALLAQEFGERIGSLEETAFILGDGSAKPTGVLATTSTSNVTTVTAASGNATAFNYDALVTARFSLPQQYRRNASWLIADGAARNLYLLKDTNGNPIWATNPAAGGPDTLLGDPIYTHPDIPAPAAGLISALYGDWNRAYTIRRVRGFSMQRQDELHSDNGQVGFRGQERVDGKVTLAAAAVAVKHSAT